MKNKLMGYLAAVVIGLGFILMAASNALNSTAASLIQAALGAVFIFAGIKKIADEHKKL